MPDVVISHSSSKVNDYVYSFPEGTSAAEIKAAVAAFGDGKWSVTKTDPADVPPPSNPVPGVPATTKE